MSDPLRRLVMKRSDAGEIEVLLASARQLQRAGAGAGAETLGLLRGKNLGMVCANEDGAEATLFRAAASALGATVSNVRPSLAESDTRAGLLRTARVLGRLYDGIECQGLAPSLVRQLGQGAGVPVFDGLASPRHATARLASLLEGADPIERKRLLMVQAVLLFALR